MQQDFACIGSVALYEHDIDIGRKRSIDVDLVGDYDALIYFLKENNTCRSIIPIDEGKKLVGRAKYVIYECEIAWENSTSKELLDLIINDPNSLKIDHTYYASMNVCYMLKMTHRFRKNSPHFLKTMNDIQTLRKLGAIIQPEHMKFYKRRLKETLSYKHPKLNQTKKDFFTDDIPYRYDHDSIHEAMKLYEKPAYAYFKEDEAEVKVSKELFFKLPYEKQLAAVYEESCVLALERSQIPYPEMDPLVSFKIALEKVCTSITSGWFREFAWENYNETLQLYNLQVEKKKSYIDLFQLGLNQNIIKLFERIEYA